MSKDNLIHSFTIIFAVISAFIVENTKISGYISYLLAILIIFLAIYISTNKGKKSAYKLLTGNPLEIYGITLIILLILLLTGSLASNLFFFLYFLFFLFAFIINPLSLWVLLLALVIFFTPELYSNPTFDNFIKIGSLLFIAPIAYFVSKELARRKNNASNINERSNEIINDANALKNSGADKDEEEILEEIIEEAEALKKDS